MPAKDACNQILCETCWISQLLPGLANPFIFLVLLSGFLLELFCGLLFLLQVSDPVRDLLGVLVHQCRCKHKVFLQKGPWCLWWVKMVYHHCVPAVSELLSPRFDRRGRVTELIGLVQAEQKISLGKGLLTKAPAIHCAACSTFQRISSAGLSASSSCQLK